MKFWSAMALCALLPPTLWAAPPGDDPRLQYWRTGDGYAMLEPVADAGAIPGADLRVSIDPSASTHSSIYPLDRDQGLIFRTLDGRFDRVLAGPWTLEVSLRLTMDVTAGGSTLRVGDLTVGLTDQGWQVRDRFNTGRVVFDFDPGTVRFDVSARRLLLDGVELRLAKSWVRELGLPAQAGRLVFEGWIEAAVETVQPTEAVAYEEQADAVQSQMTQARLSVGPDVIVGALPLIQKLGTVDAVSAYAIATTSCNIGTETLIWEAETAAHPVIAQNLYRYSNGRFEQIGMSWLKHGFCALSDNDCNLGCQATDCRSLGLGCSDTYGTFLNGLQSILGPRSDVNPSTGVFPFPFTNPPFSGSLDRRLQVPVGELDPSLNPGALYVGEAHYITADDAAAGNDENNMSWREITVGDFVDGGFELSFAGDIRPQEPAINAWHRFDRSVELLNVNPGDGKMILGHKATQLGELIWQYEYALYNKNSDRAAGSFSIGVSNWASLWDIEFHDVDSHSGEVYSADDWVAVRGDGVLTWSTEPFATNPNANALRWGTLYNFGFKSDSRPEAVNGTVGIFKPGEPATRTRTLDGPGQDCNLNGILDRFEGGLADVDGNGVPDLCEPPLVQGVDSCKEHGEAGWHCFDMLANDIESRAGRVSRLEVQLNQPMNAWTVQAANVAVACSATTYSGAIAATLDGDSRVVLDFDPGLPDEECCDVDLAAMESTLGVGVSGRVVVRSLQGDIDRQGRVTTGDASQLRFFFNRPTDAGNFAYDFNVDGQINTSDFSELRFFFNNTPGPCP